MNPNSRDTFAKLALREPFRVFFPVGMVLGITGVMLWPLYEWGLLSVYPSMMHARTLILGFIGLFVLGFMGTAFPRLLGIKSYGFFTVFGGLILHLLGQFFYLRNQIFFGEICSLILWSLVFPFIVSGFLRRKDMPPPGFLLVIAGLGCLWLSLLLTVLAGAGIWAPGWGFVLSRVFLYEAFPTLLILGVAPYFFPKILGGTNRHEFEESRSPGSRWKRLATRAALAAAVLLAGYVTKLKDPGLGSIVVSFALVTYVWVEVPLRPHSREQRGSLAFGLFLGVLGMLLGSIGPALFPQFRIGIFHLLTVGGVSLILMVVSTRVVHGHAGAVSRSTGNKWWIRCIWVLLPVAGLTRLLADVIPTTRSSHFVYAALLFVICAMIWLGKNGSLLNQEEEPEKNNETGEERFR